jgi:hypothetical protein
MDMRHVFAVLADVFCSFLIFATVTLYRHFEQAGYDSFSSPLTGQLETS